MDNTNRPPIIGVCGGHAASAGYLAQAAEAGALIAGKGWWLICGGLSGVMEAACKGAASKGGFTIGVLPGIDAASANPHVSLPIATGIGHCRNAIITSTADVVLAIDGAAGTLSEICFSIIHETPVVLLCLEPTNIDMGGISINLSNSTGFTVVYNARAAVEEIESLLEGADNGS